MVQEITDIKVISLHPDNSSSTGEKVMIFTLDRCSTVPRTQEEVELLKRGALPLLQNRASGREWQSDFRTQYREQGSDPEWT